MTTKQKFIASIWVPIVSMYILLTFFQYFISDLDPNDLLGFQPRETSEYLFGVLPFFLIGAILWVPVLIICLIIEYKWIKTEMEKVPISNILITELAISLGIIWLPIILFFPDLKLTFDMAISILLSIAARWGYLKWRKIC